MSRPAETEAAPYFFRYINLTKGETVNELVQNHSEELKKFYNAIPDEKANYAYAEGKWTIKEVMQHIIDTERVFTYRLLRFARKDSTPLHSFDENAFAQNANANNRTLASLKEELNMLRLATDIMLANLSNEQLAFTGTSSNHSTTANAVSFIIFGHLIHHKNIITERYL